MSKHNFRGLGVALVTPFDIHGHVDYRSLEQLLGRLSLGEVTDFLVIHGTTGESPCLTREERNELTHYIVEYVQGRCPIMIGLGGNNTLELGERITALDTTGLAGILSVVPYYNKPSQEGMYQHFAHIARSSTLPIVLYNVPGRVGVNMAPDTVIRLAHDFENIIGVKEASGYPQQAGQITTAKLPEDFVVLSGDDALSVAFMQNGAQGVISVVGNAFPQLTSDLIHLAMDGKYAEADMLQTQMQTINTLLFQEGNPAGIKSTLHSMGWIASDKLRLPLVSVSEELRLKLSQAAQELANYEQQYIEKKLALCPKH